MSQQHVDEATLAAFAGGTLGEREADSVRRHLSVCAECSAKLKDHKETAALVSRAARSGKPGELTAVPEAKAGRGAHPDDETLAAYSDGSLSEGEAAEIERHLALCGDCVRAVADLWAMSSASKLEPSASAVGAVRARLERDALGGAIVRLAGRSVELVRDFGRTLDDVLGSPPPRREPAFAYARDGGGSVELSWTGGDDVELSGRVDVRDGRAYLLGRLTVAGEPAVALSVALSAGGPGRGPESTDRDGYFGPWELSPGENTVIVTGSSVGENGVRLPIEVVLGQPTRTE